MNGGPWREEESPALVEASPQETTPLVTDTPPLQIVHAERNVVTPVKQTPSVSLFGTPSSRMKEFRDARGERAAEELCSKMRDRRRLKRDEGTRGRNEEVIDKLVPFVRTLPSSAMDEVARYDRDQKRKRKWGTQESVNVQANRARILEAVGQSTVAIASVNALATLWGVSSERVRENIMTTAWVTLKLQLFFLRLIVHVLSVLNAGRRPGPTTTMEEVIASDNRPLNCYSILHWKWDETKHHIAVPSQGLSGRMLRKRRRHPGAAYHVLVHEVDLRWRIQGGEEHELVINLPPQVLCDTTAEGLLMAMRAPVRAEVEEQISQCQAQSDLNFVVFEMDNATPNRKFVAHLRRTQRNLGLIVFWVWCCLHQNHAIQGLVLAHMEGGFRLMQSLYSTSLLLRTGVYWMRLTSALHSVVHKRLVIRPGQCPDNAREISSLVVHFLLEGSGGLGQEDKYLKDAFEELQNVLNGYWWDGAGIIHYCTGNECCKNGRTTTHKRVVEALMKTLFRQRPVVPQLSKPTTAKSNQRSAHSPNSSATASSGTRAAGGG